MTCIIFHVNFTSFANCCSYPMLLFFSLNSCFSIYSLYANPFMPSFTPFYYQFCLSRWLLCYKFQYINPSSSHHLSHPPHYNSPPPTNIIYISSQKNHEIIIPSNTNLTKQTMFNTEKKKTCK